VGEKEADVTENDDLGNRKRKVGEKAAEHCNADCFGRSNVTVVVSVGDKENLLTLALDHERTCAKTVSQCKAETS